MKNKIPKPNQIINTLRQATRATATTSALKQNIPLQPQTKTEQKRMAEIAPSRFAEIHPKKSLKEHITAPVNVLATQAHFVPIGKDENVNTFGLVYCRAVAMAVSDKNNNRIGTLILHHDGRPDIINKNIEKSLESVGGLKNVNLSLISSTPGPTSYLPGVDGGIDKAMEVLTGRLLYSIGCKCGKYGYSETIPQTNDKNPVSLWQRLKRSVSIARNAHFKISKEGNVETHLTYPAEQACML